METIKSKLSVLAQNRRLVRVCAAVAALLVALLVWLCISIHMRSNIQGEYSYAASVLQEQTYQNLCTMSDTFSNFSVPNADVKNLLYPQLKLAYTSVRSLNEGLRGGFGESYAVLSADQIVKFDTAFAEYDEAYRIGNATGLAEDDMSASIETVRSMIQLRYYPEEAEAAEAAEAEAQAGS